MSLLWLLLACQGGGTGDPVVALEDSGQPPVVHFESLDAPALLRRLSLDLRGTLPSEAEVLAVESDPDAVEGLRDEMLSDPRLEARLMHLLGERWLTTTEEYPLAAISVGLAEEQEYAWRRSIGEEPLRLAAHIAASDRPWSDVVLVDFTMGNEILAETWPLELVEEPDPETGWAKAVWTDGRPTVGVLASNGLRWRYTEAVYARSLATAVSKLLICDDYLSRPVSFDSPALAEDELLDATQTEQACLNCHATLDGVASAMFGMEFFDFYSLDDFATYHLERERLGQIYLGVAPVYYGTPIEGLVELGPVMADDPRLSWCAVETFTEGLWRRTPELADHGELVGLERAFDEGELRVSALLAAITDTPEYRAGDQLSGTAADGGGDAATARLMSPSQLAQSVEDLTGLRWTMEGWDQLDNDTLGFRTMAGGVNPPLVDEVARGHSVSRDLVLKRLAQAGAAHAVQGDLVDGDGPGLLSQVDLASMPGDAAFDAQLDLLHRRVLGRPPSEERRSLDEALWTEVEAASDPATAWTLLLGGLLRDPAFWTY